MPLRFLLDENISQVVADQVRRSGPEIVIESVHTWQEGTLEGQTDKALLMAAHDEHLTLVTYDLKTIPDLLIELYSEGRSHAGIVFVDNATIPNHDFGTLTRSLLSLWDRFHQLAWTDRVVFLEKSVL